ncbi:MAG: DUF370 domain-containing protein [Clostridiales bacterium]|nr:DUF370 domain-containing protein [Clostridiales bacterium]
MKLLSIGFGSAVSAARVLALVSPESAPIKRVVQEARERGMLIDASYGRRTKTVLLMDTDHVILSAIAPKTLSERMDADFTAADEQEELS